VLPPRIADYTFNKVPAPLRSLVGYRGIYREVGVAGRIVEQPTGPMLSCSAKALCRILRGATVSVFIFTPRAARWQLTISHAERYAAPSLRSGRNGPLRRLWPLFYIQSLRSRAATSTRGSAAGAVGSERRVALAGHVIVSSVAITPGVRKRERVP
jgi:hypothetical protein